jgi:hypothetical protein
MFKTLLLAAAPQPRSSRFPQCLETRIERSDDNAQRYGRGRYEERRGEYERRIVRSHFRDDCRTVEKRRVNRIGEVIVSRTLICR